MVLINVSGYQYFYEYYNIITNLYFESNSSGTYVHIYKKYWGKILRLKKTVNVLNCKLIIS